MMKVPAGIKTNSIPRELIKVFSRARIRRGSKRFSMMMINDRMHDFPDFFGMFFMTIPSLFIDRISTFQI